MRVSYIDLDSIESDIHVDFSRAKDFLLELLTLRFIEVTKPESVVIITSHPQTWQRGITNLITSKVPDLSRHEGWINILASDSPLLEMQVTRWSSFYRPTQDFSDVQRITYDHLSKEWGGNLSYIMDILALQEAGMTRRSAKNLITKTGSLKNALDIYATDPKKIKFTTEKTALEVVKPHGATLHPLPLVRTTLGAHRGMPVLHQTYQRVASKMQDVQSRIYELIDTQQQLIKLCDKLSKAAILSVDTETTGVDSRSVQLIGISIGISSKEAYYLDVPSLTTNTITKYLWPVLRTKRIIMHNAKYDLEILERYGLVIVIADLDDTMLMAHLLGKDRVGLKIRAQQDLNIDMIHIEDLIDEDFDMSMVPKAVVAEYAAGDAQQTFGLYDLYEPEFRTGKVHDLYRQEIGIVNVLRSMERSGIAIDEQSFDKMGAEAVKSLRNLEEEVWAEAGFEFDIGSLDDLRDTLFTKLGIRVVKSTASGNASTDKLSLGELADEHPIIEKILEWRALRTLYTTFIRKLPEMVNPNTHRIHTDWIQTRTATGRLSSARPNLQNIPARGQLAKVIRDSFITDKPNYVLVGADYSQLEIRIMAHYSGDAGLIAGYMSEKPGTEYDVHRYMASRLFNKKESSVLDKERSFAKMATFGIMYGLSERGLSTKAAIPLKEASDFIKNYFREFSGIADFMEEAKEFAHKHGYAETIKGRRRYFPYINSDIPAARAAAEREAINLPIQGSASDVVKTAMYNLFYEYIPKETPTAKLLLQIHDELVLEAHRDEADILREVLDFVMPSAIKLRCPLRVEAKVGRTWQEVH